MNWHSIVEILNIYTHGVVCEMGIRVLGSSASLASVLALMLMPVGVTPALSASDCTCVVPATGGPVGSISQASADVFVTGATGQQAAIGGTPLQSGSVVTTGPIAAASIDLGPQCQFSMSGSMRVQITPQANGLCVQVFDDSLPLPVADNSGGGILAGAALGGGVLVSLGFLLSVSK